MAAFPGNMHMQMPPYNDHILTVTERSCPDPYVLWDRGTYYMVSYCASEMSGAFMSVGFGGGTVGLEAGWADDLGK